MEPSLLALQKAREDVVQSRAWTKLQQEFLSQIHRQEGEAGRGQLRTFSSLSTAEKLSVVAKAVTEIRNTSAYSKLQAKVTSAVDNHFSALVFQPPPAPSSESLQTAASGSAEETISRPGAERGATSSNHQLDEACTKLLLESPHLKHSLKSAFNHSLPPRLRLTAWTLLLQHSSVENDFLISAKKMQPRNPEEKKIPRRCQALLDSNLVFRELAKRGSVLLALQSVMLYWSQMTSDPVVDAELLLCVPFVYVWKEELEERVGEDDNRPLFAKIAGQYVSFMEMLPSSMHRSDSGQEEDAMNKFSQQVEELLHTEDPTLYKALQTLFNKTAATSPSRTKLKRRGGHGGVQQTFHLTLKGVLLSHVQSMLVGVVAMDVLCYIWDQCFIGLDNPDYHCLPYFITAWMILLRNRLIACQTIEDLNEALTVHSRSLTIAQFQQQIERRFLQQLSSLLNVKPLPLQPSRPHLLPQVQHRTSDKMRSSVSHRHGGTAERDIQRKVDEIQQKVEQEQRVLSCRLKEERQEHQKQLEILRKELEELRELTGGSSRKSSIQPPSSPTPQHHVRSKSGTSASLLMDPSHVATVGSKTSRKTQDKSESQVALRTEQSSSAVAVSRPYSPSHLSQDDVQQIWLSVLNKFTTAAYTICHGTGKERQDLYTTIQPAKLS